MPASTAWFYAAVATAAATAGPVSARRSLLNSRRPQIITGETHKHTTPWWKGNDYQWMGGGATIVPQHGAPGSSAVRNNHLYGVQLFIFIYIYISFLRPPLPSALIVARQHSVALTFGQALLPRAGLAACPRDTTCPSPVGLGRGARRKSQNGEGFSG